MPAPFAPGPERLDRLPTHIEVSALIRRVNAAGGFATVMAKGESDAGTVILVMMDRQSLPRAYERMPSIDGKRSWNLSISHDPDQPNSFNDWLERRKAQDSDLWIVELDVADAERFIGFGATS